MYNVYFNIVSWEKCELDLFLWESQFGKLSKLYNADASVVSLFLYMSCWSPEGCSASQQVRLQPISFLKTGRNGCAGWTVIFSSHRKSVMRIMLWPYTPHTHTNIKKNTLAPRDVCTLWMKTQRVERTDVNLSYTHLNTQEPEWGWGWVTQG